MWLKTVDEANRKQWMAYFRFTIRQLLVATVLVGFVCATLLHPSQTLFWIWAGLSWTGFAALAATAIIGSDFYRRAAIGAMIFCGLQLAMLSFEAFSGEQHRAASWEVMGFRIDGWFELWNVPGRSVLQRVPGALDFESSDADPVVITGRDSYLLGILRWQWLWALAGIGWVLGGFVVQPASNNPGRRPSSGRFRWLYIVAISAAWVVCWQVFRYELASNRLSGVAPRGMWSTFIPPLTLWAWQVLTLFAILGSPSTRVRLSVISAATGLWLAMAFFPGWSATLGDFLPQTMAARALSPPDTTRVSLAMPENRIVTTSPAIVQGEVIPSVTIATSGGSPDPLFDPPPRLGLAAYLVGGVIGGQGRPPMESIVVSIAACMMVWPIALASRWLARRVSRATDANAPLCATPTFWHVSALLAMFILALVSRQAWVVQLSLLAVYAAMALFMSYALVGLQSARREYTITVLAMLGWLLISCGSWFGDLVRPHLPTTIAFMWIDKQLGCKPGEPGPDMALSSETERSLRTSGVWGNRVANVWPTVVASLGLDHRYPLSTPGTILMAFPAAWIGRYLLRGYWRRPVCQHESPSAS